jgi:hypothetical protein
MTSSELVNLAARNGLIFWPKSGVYESLSLVYGRVIAQGLTTKPHPILLRSDYTCIEVDPKANISIGDLLRPARVIVKSQ